jgi:NTP pyrophosphatase (non-canonical NTP hydrolase)
MDFRYYQAVSKKTAIYSKALKILYPTMGLAGEAGEVSNKVKKIYRDKAGKYTLQDRNDIADELGDVLWYISQLASDFNICLEGIAEDNIRKLQDRKKRNMLRGNGDKR